MGKNTIKPVSVKDNVIFQVKAEEKEEFHQLNDLTLIRVVDRYDWKNKTNEGTAISVPDVLTDKVWATPTAYKKPVGRPEPTRRITGDWFNQRVAAYKDSLLTHAHNIESMDYFNHLVDNFKKRFEKNLKYMPTDWVPKHMGQDVWKMEVQEGDKIFFDESALDDGARMEYSKREKPFYTIAYDQIVAYERDGKIYPTAGHILLEPIKEERDFVTIIEPTNIVSALGEKMKIPKERKEIVELENQGIVRYLPAHTINNESIGCKEGDHILTMENALKKVRIQGKDYLKCKYREILGVMKESQ